MLTHFFYCVTDIFFSSCILPEFTISALLSSTTLRIHNSIYAVVGSDHILKICLLKRCDHLFSEKLIDESDKFVVKKPSDLKRWIDNYFSGHNSNFEATKRSNTKTLSFEAMKLLIWSNSKFWSDEEIYLIKIQVLKWCNGTSTICPKTNVPA
jgi:hypothetical protein